ncbi:Fur family transcriptional regulator [Odoribacter sp. Z80]|uniref:Fur family transcriptional regulator n=1 Tax=Odoribacter sp. Z80 TaxID=2304575 RepID=UPI00137AE04B|nr:transcriptional repressor [Odoribacter sp. Z80]NCE71413.1 transcriptional repressor [Odoribacter sp. Z80]
MENEQFYLDKLSLREIKPTAMRILILKTMLKMQRAVSLTDLENELDSVDKSTIFRTVTLFLSRHLIHGVDDGSGALKYAVCSDSCNCSVEDQHSHFYCEQCRRTFCFKHIHVPLVDLPEGFAVHSINYVLKGICPACRKD